MATKLVAISPEDQLEAGDISRFVEWLLARMILVGIRAPSRDSGFRIFESMNDRGTRLTPVDLLKSFLLSHVGEGEEDLNLRWRRMLSELTISRDDEGAPTRFLRAALTARHARVSRNTLWEFDPGEQRAYLLLGEAHDRPAHWWTRKGLHLYALHEPPCVGDTLQRRDLPLSTIALTAGGLVIPDPVHREIEQARATVRDAAQARAARSGRRRPQPGSRPAPNPAPQPDQQTPHGPRPATTARPGKLACTTCNLPLDPILAHIGRHIGC
ncbi:MAG: DUF262 domain-containing protein [Streptosporangiaceae bacterium]|jgi:hypothetical protein